MATPKSGLFLKKSSYSAKNSLSRTVGNMDRISNEGMGTAEWRKLFEARCMELDEVVRSAERSYCQRNQPSDDYLHLSAHKASPFSGARQRRGDIHHSRIGTAYKSVAAQDSVSHHVSSAGSLAQQPVLEHATSDIHQTRLPIHCSRHASSRSHNKSQVCDAWAAKSPMFTGDRNAVHKDTGFEVFPLVNSKDCLETDSWEPILAMNDLESKRKGTSRGKAQSSASVLSAKRSSSVADADKALISARQTLHAINFNHAEVHMVHTVTDWT
jgi:hypothetical protein